MLQNTDSHLYKNTCSMFAIPIDSQLHSLTDSLPSCCLHHAHACYICMCMQLCNCKPPLAIKAQYQNTIVYIHSQTFKLHYYCIVVCNLHQPPHCKVMLQTSPPLPLSLLFTFITNCTPFSFSMQIYIACMQAPLLVLFRRDINIFMTANLALY